MHENKNQENENHMNISYDDNDDHYLFYSEYINNQNQSNLSLNNSKKIKTNKAKSIDNILFTNDSSVIISKSFLHLSFKIISMNKNYYKNKKILKI